jgi:predicted RNA-binding Zn ribbon-like protein
VSCPGGMGITLALAAARGNGCVPVSPESYVIFNHDVERSLEIVVDFVNTGPTASGAELLPDPHALATWAKLQDLSDVGDISADHVTAAHDVRDRLRAVFLSDGPSQAAALLNALFRSATVAPRLTDHDGYEWHFHYFAPGASVADHLAVDGGMALGFVIVAGEHERLRVCAAPGCGRVLVDLSRNRSKRYCDSRTCGNRLHVAAYRERRRSAVAS